MKKKTEHAKGLLKYGTSWEVIKHVHDKIMSGNICLNTWLSRVEVPFYSMPTIDHLTFADETAMTNKPEINTVTIERVESKDDTRRAIYGKAYEVDNTYWIITGVHT